MAQQQNKQNRPKQPQDPYAQKAKQLTSSDEDINSLMVELIASHTLG
jgi:hypothetical protein